MTSYVFLVSLYKNNNKRRLSTFICSFKITQTFQMVNMLYKYLYLGNSILLQAFVCISFFIVTVVVSYYFVVFGYTSLLIFCFKFRCSCHVITNI
jgi:hypothetical protein